MKKFLLMVVACIAAFASASAADLYIRGGFFDAGWAVKEAGKMTDNGDGTYSITLAKLNGEFKFGDATWTNSWGGDGSVINANLDTDYTVVNNSSSKNIKVNGEWTNVTITLNTNTGKFKAVGSAAATDWSTIDLYLRGALNSWGYSDATKFANNNGVYTLSIDALTGTFKIADAGWNKSFGYDDVTISGTAASKVKKASSDGNFDTTEALSNVSMTFNAANASLVINADANGGGGGDTPSEGVTIVGDYNIAYSGNHTNIYYWGGSEGPNWPGKAMETATGSDGKTYKVYKVSDGTKNVIFNGTGNQTGDLTYKAGYIFNDNGATSTPVTFTTNGGGGGDDPQPGEYDGWYVNVVGTFNGWADNGVAVPADGITKHEGLQIGDKGFKIKIWNGTANTHYSTGEAVAQNQWVTIPVDESDLPCMTVTGAVAGDIFTVEYNVATNQVKLTKTGSGEVDETVAYAIHGSLVTGEWADLALTEVDGKWVANDVECVDGQFGVKKLVGGIQDGWYNTTAATTVSESTSVTLEKDGGNNISIAAGTYSFALNPTTMVLAITKAGGNDPEPPTPNDYENWYVNIKGEYNGWAGNGVHPDANGLTKHENLQIGTEGFKVNIWTGTEDVWYSTGAAVAQGAWVNIDQDVMPSMTVEGAAAGDIFTVEFNVLTKEVKLTKTGSGEVDETVTYAIHGSLASSEWADVALTEVDSKWVAENVTVVAGQFGVKKNVGGVQKAWFNSAEAVEVTATTTVTLAQDGGNNIGIAAGKYTFSLDPTSMVLAITKIGNDDPEPPVPTDWANTPMYIRGAFNSWGYDETADKMTWNGTAYTITKESLEGQFCFSSTDWAYKTTYADVTLAGNAADKITDASEDHNFGTTETLSNVTFTLNPETKVLTVNVEGTNPPVENYDGWYVNVLGTYNGWTDNGIAVPADGIVKHENLQIGTKGFKVKVWNGTENSWFSTGEAVSQNEWVSIDADVADCMTVAGAQEGDIFTVEYNVATKMVKVTLTGNQPVDNTVSYCIHGSLVNGTWADLNLTENNGKWEANDVECVGGEFGVKKLVGGVQDGWYCVTEATTVSATTTLNLVKDGGVNVKVLAGTYSFSLDPDTMALVITNASAGIEAVAAEAEGEAMYFNLQGIRINNPAAGQVYIRVIDGKVSKVVL